jgi:starch synthase
MPSNYEPCGIGQIVAMRYGTIPVVRETGGLKDTVQQYDKYTQTGNGFVFSDYNAHEMMYALKRALSSYENYEEWNHIVHNAMATDFSWDNSAKEYKKLYEQLANK